MTARALLIVAWPLLAAALACSDGTDPTDLPPIVGNAPEQLAVTGAPTIARYPHPDTAIYFVTIPTVDSAAHRTWRPTRLALSSDRMPPVDYIAVPFACLLPKSNGSAFPFNFEWRTCNHILVQTTSLLDARQLRDMSDALSGRVAWVRLATSSPGAFYMFQVPVGREAVAEAARRALLFSVVVLADGLSNDPECVRSDAVPPPPCPPWHLVARVPYTYGTAVGDTLPVSSGGWIRAQYIDATGTMHQQEVAVP